MQTTTIMVHPAVRRQLENLYGVQAGVVDFRKSAAYAFISAGLRRNGLDPRSQAAADTKALRSITVAVTEWDAAHYGLHIPAKYQKDFSQWAYRQLLECACTEVMLWHVIAGLPRDAAIKEFIARGLFEEDELNYAALRKHYQRHWMERERELGQECESLSALPRHRRVTNKSVGIVPF